MSEEQRDYRRIHIEVPVLISVEGRLFKKKLRLESRDVSGGGLCFVTRQRLPIDARSKVVVSKIGDFLDSAHIEAVIVYLRKDRAKNNYRVGIEFTKFVDVERKALLEKLEEWESNAGAPAATPSV